MIKRMSAFRKVFGIVCLIFAIVAMLSLFKLISLNINIVVVEFSVITAISFFIDVLLAKNEKTASKQRRAED